MIFGKDQFLVDFDLKLLNHICSMLSLDESYLLSKDYVNDNGVHDYRQSINPKKRLQKPDRYFQPVNYRQVFAERFGFIPNMSIVDLIFNVGPNSRRILEASIKRGH